MKNNIMKTINNMYKSTPTLEESELLKLDSLLTRVGGDAKSILLKSEEYTMADFIDTCIRNGITFELREDVVESSPPSETAPVRHDSLSPIQSPYDKENSSEDGCTEAEVLRDYKRQHNNNNNGDLRELLRERERKVRARQRVYFEEDNTCENGRKYYVEK